MKDCRVCGTPDEKKPMAFRGENHCSELHRKILAGELGNDVGTLFEQGIVTQAQAARLWGTKIEDGKTLTITQAVVNKMQKSQPFDEQRPPSRSEKQVRSAQAEEHYLLERPKPGEK